MFKIENNEVNMSLLKHMSIFSFVFILSVSPALVAMDAAGQGQPASWKKLVLDHKGKIGAAAALAAAGGIAYWYLRPARAEAVGAKQAEKVELAQWRKELFNISKIVYPAASEQAQYEIVAALNSPVRLAENPEFKRLLAAHKQEAAFASVLETFARTTKEAQVNEAELTGVPQIPLWVAHFVDLLQKLYPTEAERQAVGERLSDPYAFLSDRSFRNLLAQKGEQNAFKAILVEYREFVFDMHLKFGLGIRLAGQPEALRAAAAELKNLEDCTVFMQKYGNQLTADQKAFLADRMRLINVYSEQEKLFAATMKKPTQA